MYICMCFRVREEDGELFGELSAEVDLFIEVVLV